MRSDIFNLVLLTGLCCLLLASHPAAAQADAAAAQEHLRAASEAYREGDLEGLTAALETAAELNPFSLYTRYNLACGYARTGRDAEALDILQGLVAARVDFGMADDEDLESLRDNPEFTRLVGLLEQRVQPVLASTHRFASDEPGLIPEGIAIDAATNRLFVGSMRTGDIYVINADDDSSIFAAVRHEGKLSAIGLEVDSARGILWAIGSAFDTVEGFDADAPMRTGLFGFDLETGELVHKMIGDESFTGFNDVTVAPSGDIFLSGGEVAVVRDGSDTIVHLETSIPIYGSNGITLDADGSHLIVSSYPVGIAVIDLQTGQANWLQAPVDTTLYGVDGLYWHEGDLVAVQNGVNPWRLIRMELDEGLTTVTSARLIEFANDDIGPTTGAIDGDVIHFVGHGPQPDTVPDGFPAALAPMAGKTIVMTAPLN
jgi:sugar lactone lactonase YvrE